MNNKPQIIQLTNETGMHIELCSFGATLLGCTLPLVIPRNVVLTCKPEELAVQDMYLGATVGRYANRIAHARFSVDGFEQNISANQDGTHTLHGGIDNFAYREWQVTQQTVQSVTFALYSADGDQGFAGNMHAQVTYTLVGTSLQIDYLATNDQPSVCNMTNHAYFNLDGIAIDASTKISDARNHILQIHSDRCMPLSAEGLPLDNHQPLANVTNTPFDFRHSKTLLEDFAQVLNTHVLKQKQLGESLHGYDHDWYFGDNGTMKDMCILQSANKDIRLTMRSTQPTLRVYTGNHLQSSQMSLEKGFDAYAGIALETGCLANSPNMPRYQSECFIDTHTPYQHTCVYEFDF